MSGSRCPVSARGNCLWGSPPPQASRGKMPRASAVWPPLPLPAHKWWLLLWGVLQACSTQGSVLLAQRLPQKLTSPGYPEPYVKGQESSTDIEAPEGFAVRLIFQDFDLELSPDCEGDSVTVSWVGPRRDCGEGAFQPGEQGQWEAAVALNPEACLGGQITASGMDPSRFCGQQGSPLGSTPGDREFVSLGNSLRLTFRAPASSEDGTPGLHKGFLALYQAVDMNHSQPISQASGGPEAINTHRDNPAKVQSHCQAPYYQAVAAGTLSCTAQVPWKQAQEGEDVLSCVPVCGRPVNPIAQDRETHGASRAEPGNFPWQALTSIYGRGGGALLGDRWVLTAAHTVYPKDGFFLGKSRSASVFLGHTSAAELLQRGGHPVRRVVVHPDYRQNESHNFHGDIALLELQHGVPLGPSLLPVCLPAREALYRSGRLGYVSGFGVQMGWLTTELKYSRLPVAPREACEAWLRDKRRSEVFSDNMFCAGDEMLQQGVCQGDSGGAFVVWDDRAHHWVATGIVSWGIGCGKGYGFYTKVLNYVDWIKSVMGRKD